MPGRAMWRGTIRFGDVSVAVKLHAAVKEERIQFHLLHRPDGARLHQLMVCAYEKKPVPAEAQTRGFEVEEGRYLLVEPEELEGTLPEGSRNVEVHEFVKAAEIDPLYFDHVYSLEPDGVLKGYEELAQVLGEFGAAGICTWTMRKRVYLGALQAFGNALRLSTLRYADEVVSADSLGLGQVSVTDKELKIGRDLIGQLTARFEPEKFVNEHQNKLRELIAKKARGEKVAVLRPKILPPTAPDKLLEALEASLKRVA